MPQPQKTAAAMPQPQTTAAAMPQPLTYQDQDLVAPTAFCRLQRGGSTGALTPHRNAPPNRFSASAAASTSSSVTHRLPSALPQPQLLRKAALHLPQPPMVAAAMPQPLRIAAAMPQPL